VPTDPVAVRVAGFDALGAAGFFGVDDDPDAPVFDPDGFFGLDGFLGTGGFLADAGFAPDVPRDGPEPPAGRAEAPGRGGRREDGMPRLCRRPRVRTGSTRGVLTR